MCCKTNTAQGNDDLEKAVTKPSNICLRILLPADAKCPDRFVRFSLHMSEQEQNFSLMIL